MFAGASWLRRVFLLLSLPLVLLLVSCAQGTPPPSGPHLSSDPVVRWIQQYAIPLRTVNPGGSDADLAPLKQIVGQTDLALYMLDLRDMSPGPARTWASSPAIFINYGLGGENLSTRAILNQWFDAIIHVQNTTPANHF